MCQVICFESDYILVCGDSPFIVAVLCGNLMTWLDVS